MKSIYDYVSNTASPIDAKTMDQIAENTKWLIKHMKFDDEDLEILEFWTDGKVLPAGSEALANRVPVIHVAMFYKSYNHNIDNSEDLTNLIRWEADDFDRDYYVDGNVLVMIDAVSVHSDSDIKKYKQKAKRK